MKISTKGRYAVEALFYMALIGENDSIGIKQISRYTYISEKYLEQIFFILRKAGILSTKRGSKGGYQITRKLSDITVGEILLAVEKDIVPVECIKNPNKCVSGISDTCRTRKVWCDISHAIDNVIYSITLEDLVNDFLEDKTI